MLTVSRWFPVHKFESVRQAWYAFQTWNNAIVRSAEIEQGYTHDLGSEVWDKKWHEKDRKWKAGGIFLSHILSSLHGFDTAGDALLT